MYRLSSIVILILMGYISAGSQSPHGKGFTMDCAKCHSPESWSFNSKSNTFNHDSTAFPLTGQHVDLDCRSCHTSPVFNEVKTECISCHADIHQQTVGSDCARCHTPQSWIVENITGLHEQISFPLMGVHAIINCNQCHQSETNVRFSPTGTECINCHLDEYNAAKMPDHIKLGFGNDCAACHSLTGTEWNTEIVDHSFFPLEQGHMISDCAACHKSENYSDLSADCVSCHQTDFNNTLNPNHFIAGFSTDCVNCHTISSGWKPVTFATHDVQHFPIYSGKHQGVWNDCMECHTNSSDYTQFTCVSCHKNPETNDLHQNISGYMYDNNACLACHPSGDAENAFNHNATNFPLTGAHTNVDCISCHFGGYEGTSTLCVDCHTIDFNQTVNPNHTQLGLNKDCAACHTTVPGWSPATFEIHNTYYPLNGAHALIANDCASCHNGNYNNTPNTCFGCHNQDFTGAQDPDHILNQFSEDCATCHSESAWSPSTFNHDGLYFPIYSGKHLGQWAQCVDCHTVEGDFKQFTCITCHQNPETDNVHNGISGYNYNNNACLACHPTGDADMAFNHNDTAFPLTGAHTSVDCISCHANGYQGTSTICVDCHTIDFNQTVNPNHTALGLNTDCASCHTPVSGWSPATFSIHNVFYPLNGAHALIANDCAGCHNGNYNDTPNTCFGCHNNDYNATTDPNHIALQLPTDCASCHSESAWIPSTFQHDGMYFPIFSGKHQGTWSNCVECHGNSGNWAEFTCITCHQNPETDNQHLAVGGYSYFSPACLACHPTGDADLVFDHNTTAFPLTGAHTTVECLTCHANGFEGTPTLCVSCHTSDFNQSLNPNHNSLNITTDCILCHTTTPGWSPASFPVHNEFYMLNGAHAAISSDCIACHNGNYNNTPTTCVGCHNDDYIATTDPNHINLQFPTDCATCHSESSWNPSTFNHDGQYFPINSGKHLGTWNQCLNCHNNPANYSQFTCTTCHQNPETNEQHPGVSGYVYSSPACLACHPTGDADNIFDHNSTTFPLTGAHIGVECTSCHSTGFQGTSVLCVDCHTIDFNQTINPNHPAIGISTDCASCHTTAPGWSPATFVNHNDYYLITGAHTAIASGCAACHNGNYTNTPNTCIGCHTADFNNTTNPDHEVAMFPTDCTTCHSQSAWAPSTFNHSTIYPLTGAHATIANNCVECHANGYNNTPNTCVGCHQSDFNTSANPNHPAIGISTDCASCHTTAPGWSPATFANHNDYYLITGAHTAIAADCAACHNGNYNNTPNTCIGCHAADFNNTTDPDHEAQQFPTDCISCHSQSAWAPSTFNHNTVYPLIGAHATIANNCVVCHNGNYTNTPNTCIGCHTADFNNTTNPDHEVAMFPTDCTTCHSQSAWSPSTFNHSTIYPLTGAHAAIASNCVECHANGYNNTPNTCVGCHQSDFNTSSNPNHPAIGISTDCASCHTTAPGWSPATFANHNDYYLITGAHTAIAADCAACHNGNYNNTPNTCVGCHAADFNNTTNPDHEAQQFPTDCISCHSQSAWAPSTFNHNTVYSLIGAHAAIANNCVVCHNGNYTNTPNTCIGCHTADFNNTTNPDHEVAMFPTDCTTCHSQSAWAPSTFNHSTIYPLTGAHAAIASNCVECHANGYNNTPNTCVGCHQSDFNTSSNPNHPAIGISTDCASCHTTAPGWSPATFANHNDFYLITGAHTAIAADCAACHNGNYNNTPNTCVGCHSADFNNTTDPDHEAQQFPTDCISCHSQSAWAPSTFNHNTVYPLIGAHAAIANNCVVCHNGNYTNTPNTCIGCHTADFNNTTNPDHEVAMFPTDCTTCHSQSAWSPSTFNHSTIYPLTGAHATIANNCVECHVNGYNNTPNTCVGCHQSDFNTSSNPNHPTIGISTDCVSCHTTAPGWSPATFANHNDYYLITGAHTAIAADCAACHNGNYNNTPNTCVGCHQSDYNSTNNPDHVDAQFSTDCISCHTQSAWTPSTFNHNSFYPLIGAHAAIANNCVVCHNGNYTNTPNTCIGCHASDYNSATNPNHQTAQFPTDCTACHSQSSWEPATFNHDNMYFPIYSGKHDGEWDQCIECHINPNNYAIFSCIDCHEHDNQNDVDDDHDEVNGYQYNSNACFACHPDGND